MGRPLVAEMKPARKSERQIICVMSMHCRAGGLFERSVTTSPTNCNGCVLDIEHVGIAVSRRNRVDTMLDDLIAHLIELIANIWSADTQIRDQSLLGESEDDKQSRSSVTFLCGGAIVLLICVAVGWWWHR